MKEAYNSSSSSAAAPSAFTKAAPAAGWEAIDCHNRSFEIPAILARPGTLLEESCARRQGLCPVSSGCVRLLNQDIIDLYRRVPVGTGVVVLPAGASTA